MLIATIIFLIMMIGLIFRATHFGAVPKHDTPEIKSCKTFDGKQFANINGIDMSMNLQKFKTLLPQLLKRNKNLRPKKSVQIASKPSIPFAGSCGDAIQVTFLGHSSIMIDVNSKRILFDPVLSKYASPFPGFVKRFRKSILFNNSDFNRLGKIDAIVISHDHYDHLDYKTIYKLKDITKTFYVPLGVGAHLRKWKIDSAKIIEADWWQEFIMQDLKFVCTPAQHFSGRRAGKKNNTLWSSWLLQVNDKNIYFSGDTGYSNSFKKISDKYGPIDFAMLECGQYNELWKEIHMLPEQTVNAALDLNTKSFLPIHNMAFNLALHPWNEPIKRVKAAALKHDIEAINLLPGTSLTI